MQVKRKRKRSRSGSRKRLTRTLLLTLLVLLLVLPATGRVDAQTAGEVTLAVYGDPKGHNAIHERILHEIAAFDPDLILNTGDLVPVGFWQPSWNRFLRTIGRVFDLSSGSPLYLAVPGNHDIVGDEEDYSHWHRNLPWLPGNGTFYVVDRGPVRLIVLDANPGAFTPVQTDSLRRWLEGNTRPWVIAAWHQVSFPFGSKPMHAYSRDEWWPLLYEYGVDLVINGHAHYYARSRPLRPQSEPPFASVAADGPVQIISAAGGAGRYRVGRDEDNAPYFDELLAVAVDSVYSWCALTVSDSVLTLEARSVTGDLLDRFVLARRDRFP